MQTNIIVIAALEMEIKAINLPAGINICYSGVGKINATLTTMRAIEQFRPKLIINFGTAGAVHPDTTGLLGIRRVVQRDMITEPLSPRGKVPFCPRPHEFFSSEGEHTCGTGDSFVNSHDPWLESQDISIVDMELYAIAAVAYEYKTPWVSYKYVTDHTNSESGTDWKEKVNHGEELFLQKLKTLL